MRQDRAADRAAGTFEEDAVKRIVLLLAAALACGCAALGSGSTADSEIDGAYVAAVERAAKRFGTQVIWVNYPRKRAESTQ